MAADVGLADVNLPGTGVSTGAVWGDYDNDGYEDVFLYKWGKPELFHNDGGKHFTRVTEQAGLPPWVNANTAIWFDYDSDGKLDLFLGGYYPENVDLWHLKTTKIMPESFEYAQNGGRKYLFHNLGDGRFEEVSAQARYQFAALVAGCSRGRPSRHGLSRSLRRQRLRRFGALPQRGRQAISRGRQRGWRRICAQERHERVRRRRVEPGAVRRLCIEHFRRRAFWCRATICGCRRPGKTAGAIRYENMANAMGVELGGWSFGAQFGDLNNDGFLDLYVDQRQRLARSAPQLLVRLLQSGRRQHRPSFPTPRTGRRSTGVSSPGTSISGSGSTMARAASKKSLRWSA